MYINKLIVCLVILTSLIELGASNISMSVNNALSSETINGKNVSVVDLNKPFGIEITLDKADKNSQKIDLVGNNHIDILGQHQSAQITQINGVTTSTTRLQLTVKAKHEGVFDIGPARLTCDKETLESNIVTVKAAKGIQSHSPDNQVNKQNSSEIRCTLTADAQSAVVGQPILVRARIYVQGNIVEMGLTPLQATDCLIKDIAQPMTFQETIDGKQWNVIEKKYIVTPLQQGTKKIEAATATISVPAQPKRQRGWPFGDDFFGAVLGMNSIEQKHASSNELLLTAHPLPQHTKPVDAVGDFSQFHASLSTHEATVGEPIVLTLTIAGKGNLDAIAIPKLALDQSFKYYESKHTTHQNLSTDFTPGEKVFEFIIQASKDGQFDIPAQSFTFYDYTKQTYRTLTTSSLPVTIKPSTQPQSTQAIVDEPTEQKPEDTESKFATQADIGFIQEEQEQAHHQALPWWLFAIILIVPGAFFISSSMRKTLRSIGFISNKKNSKKLEASYKKRLASITESNSVKQVYPLFLEFFAQQNHIDISQVTEDWIEHHLTKRGWESKKIYDFLDYLGTCAQQNFARSQQNNEACGILLKKAHYWFLMLTQ